MEVTRRSTGRRKPKVCKGNDQAQVQRARYTAQMAGSLINNSIVLLGDQTLVEVKVEELYRCAFETMRKELVQHDERLEKEREEARRRDADLCSQRPGDLLQNLVQTSVTKA